MYSFENIKNNEHDIDQTVLNIISKTRTSIYSWNGQFSPQFIEALLDTYAQKNDIVIDPFMGSGTTLIECARKDIEASGIELNPSAFYMSKSFEICNLSYNIRKNLLHTIDLALAQKDMPLLKCLEQLIHNQNSQYIQNIVSLLLILLNASQPSSIEVIDKWNELKMKILSFPFATKNIQAIHSDTRKTTFKDKTFSLLITSPPYINVFNYHQNYRQSVEALGFNVLKIAKCELGANRKHRSNRLYTLVQYCIDMALAMQEWKRICTDKARFILIVGRESNVLSLAFSNSKLVYEIACEVLQLDFIMKQERVFKNRFGKMIIEDILHFSNTKYQESYEQETLIHKARRVALRALEEKLNLTMPQSTFELLNNAINNIEKIKQSDEISLEDLYGELYV